MLCCAMKMIFGKEEMPTHLQKQTYIIYMTQQESILFHINAIFHIYGKVKVYETTKGLVA